jgi:tetratricopeptide (TPR) repeat protein
MAHNNIGVLYDQTGEYHKARDVYYRALLIDPQQIFAHFNLAQGYLSKVRNIPKAIEHFYGVLDSNPRRLDVNGKLAWCLREEKRLEEALKGLDDYFYLRPLLSPSEEGYANEDFANYQLLIAVYRDLGQDDKALEIFEKLQREHPDSVGVRREYIRELIRQERLPEALRELKSLAFLTPKDANVQLQTGGTQYRDTRDRPRSGGPSASSDRAGRGPIRVLAASRPLLAGLLKQIDEQSE